jgi:hypothetical protein
MGLAYINGNWVNQGGGVGGSSPNVSGGGGMGYTEPIKYTNPTTSTNQQTENTTPTDVNTLLKNATLVSTEPVKNVSSGLTEQVSYYKTPTGNIQTIQQGNNVQIALQNQEHQNQSIYQAVTSQPEIVKTNSIPQQTINPSSNQVQVLSKPDLPTYLNKINQQNSNILTNNLKLQSVQQVEIPNQSAITKIVSTGENILINRGLNQPLTIVPSSATSSIGLSLPNELNIIGGATKLSNNILNKAAETGKDISQSYFNLGKGLTNEIIVPEANAVSKLSSGVSKDLSPILKPSEEFLVGSGKEIVKASGNIIQTLEPIVINTAKTGLVIGKTLSPLVNNNIGITPSTEINLLKSSVEPTKNIITKSAEIASPFINTNIGLNIPTEVKVASTIGSNVIAPTTKEITSSASNLISGINKDIIQPTTTAGINLIGGFNKDVITPTTNSIINSGGNLISGVSKDINLNNAYNGLKTVAKETIIPVSQGTGDLISGAKEGVQTFLEKTAPAAFTDIGQYGYGAFIPGKYGTEYRNLVNPSGEYSESAKSYGQVISKSAELGSYITPGLGELQLFGGLSSAGLIGGTSGIINYAKENPRETIAAGLYGLGEGFKLLPESITSPITKPINDFIKTDIKNTRIDFYTEPKVPTTYDIPVATQEISLPTGEVGTKTYYATKGNMIGYPKQIDMFGNSQEKILVGGQTIQTKQNFLGRVLNKEPEIVYEGNPIDKLGYKEAIINNQNYLGMSESQAKAVQRYSAAKIPQLDISGTKIITQVGEKETSELIGSVKVSPADLTNEGIKTKGFQPYEIITKQQGEPVDVLGLEGLKTKNAESIVYSKDNVIYSKLSNPPEPSLQVSISKQINEQPKIFNVKSVNQEVLNKQVTTESGKILNKGKFGELTFTPVNSVQLPNENIVELNPIKSSVSISKDYSELLKGTKPRTSAEINLDIKNNANDIVNTLKDVYGESKTKTVYHGTTSSKVNNILEQGLKPASETGNYNGIAQPPTKVSLTTDKSFAESFSNRAVNKELQTGANSEPVILKVKVPKSEVSNALYNEIKVSEVPKEQISILKEVKTNPSDIQPVIKIETPNIPKVNTEVVSSSLGESAFHNLGTTGKIASLGSTVKIESLGVSNGRLSSIDLTPEKTNTLSKAIQSESSSDLSKSNNETKLNTNLINVQSNNSNQNIIQTPKNNEAQKQNNNQQSNILQNQNQMQNTKLINPNAFQNSNTNMNELIKIKPVIVPTSSKVNEIIKLAKKKIAKDEFEVFVKRKKKFVDTGSSSDIFSAGKKLKEELLSDTSASGFILNKRTNQKVNASNFIDTQFRTGKNDKFLVIERKGGREGGRGRLQTRNEVLSIKNARRNKWLS